MFNNTFLLRIAVIIILVMHSLPGMLDGSIAGFGTYLNDAGFSPAGLPLAWTVKIAHLVTAICLLANKFVKPACLLFMLILIAGIFMVHLQDGWYVVGGGRNGIEFNFLLIIVLLVIMYPRGITSARKR